MPISSGFGYLQTNYPTPRRIVPPQIISRARKFRENQRTKNSNGLLSNSKAKVGNKLPEQRPTAVVKQPSRSDTFTLLKKSDGTNSKVPKVNQTHNARRRQAVREPVAINSQPPFEQKRTQTIRKNGDTRPMQKRPDKFIDQEDPQRHPVRFTNQEDPQRHPVRFTNQYNNTYSSSPPVYYQKPVPVADPLPHDTLGRSRRVPISNNQYIIHRQKKPPADDYTDYHTENPQHKTRSQRIVHTLRDPPYRDPDDLYYVESEPKRMIYEQPKHRTKVIPRAPPSPEYVYVDESPSPPLRRRRSPPPPPPRHRPKLVYVDNDRPVNYEEEIVYVDDNGKEIDYIYDTEPIYHQRNSKKSRQPSY